VADPEIDILWRGEWIIREWMDTGCYHVQDEHRAVLGLLVGELERIRKMRVARWQARQRRRWRTLSAAIGASGTCWRRPRSATTATAQAELLCQACAV